MLRLNRAYQVLGDPKNRREYDRIAAAKSIAERAQAPRPTLPVVLLAINLVFVLVGLAYGLPVVLKEAESPPILYPSNKGGEQAVFIPWLRELLALPLTPRVEDTTGSSVVGQHITGIPSSAQSGLSLRTAVRYTWPSEVRTRSSTLSTRVNSGA